MRSFRTAIISAVVLVLAGGAYWFFDIKRKKDKTEKKAKEAVLFETSGRKVARLVLKTKGSEPIVLERRDKPSEEKAGEGEEPDEAAGEAAKEKGRRKKKGEDAKEPAEGEYEWFVIAPVQTGGDKAAIDQLVASIKEAKREEVVLETLDKEEEFGLKEPDFSVEFAFAGESGTHGIGFGIRSLDRKRVFAKVAGEQRIVAVPSSLRDQLEKGLFDLRDKRIAPFASENMVQVTKVTGAESFIIKKEEDGWYFLPDRTKALESRVDLYSGYLRWGNIAQIIEEKGNIGNFPKYGLDKPRLIITFKLADGGAFLFWLGNPVREGDAEFYYAARSSDGMVMQVTADTAEKLAMTKFEIKDRHIFSFDPRDVVKASFKYDDQDFSVEKEGEEWKFPGDTKFISRGYSIENTVFAVSSAEYEDVPPARKGEPGYPKKELESPRYTITLQFSDNRAPVVVKVSEKDEATSKCWMTPDDGATAYRIFGYFISNLPENKDELME